jgi:uncharacterized protein
MLTIAADRFDPRDGATHPFSLCGKSFVADLSGALYWPAEKALLVADLHLEKGSAHAARGRMLPPYDTRETLIKLAEAIDRHSPETVIALGDSLHDKGAAARLSEDDLRVLAMLQEGRRWIWVTGNHDPEIAPQLGGEVLEDITLEGITLRHAPREAHITHEIAGHLHPAARVSLYGHTIRRPCFVGNGRRLVMPAFGAFTGGLNVLDKAFEPLFGPDGLNVIVLGQEGLYPVATRLLRSE